MNHNFLRTIIIKINSILFYFLLKYIFKIKIGTNFKISGVPYLKLKGINQNIVIGNNVTIHGNIDLRIRENGKIVIMDGVTIEENCRFVAAREAVISIGKKTSIGRDAIWNCGANVSIGEDCLFGPRSAIMPSEHGSLRNKKIKDQNYIHFPIRIGDDCNLGINVTVLKGVNIKPGCFIGANSVVTKDTEDYSIYAGQPAKKISYRK